MKFLVLGGSGYIGSHFVWEALAQGHQCLVYDNLSRGHEWLVKGKAQLVKGSLSDEELLTKIVKEFRPDAILHYAALALVGESVAQPDLYYFNNVAGTKSILDVLKKESPATPFVFSSSCAIFGSPKTLPVNENLPLAPESPYGRTKAICEQMMGDYATAFGMRMMALRYFNAAGAHVSGEIGEAHAEETHLIPNVITKGRRGESVSIFGNDYPTRDGTCLRDYIHVTDLAISHLDAIHFLQKQKPGIFETANLGTGDGFTNLEVVAAVKKYLELDIAIKFEPRRPGDAVALYADNSKARSLLNFTPRHSSLENIIRTAGKWHLSGRFQAD